ncbi:MULTISPECIES: amidohydrolase family protein [unclassified Pseudofrankia]|uniref:amidohydrolase family protein n=1 Tax=unclassified Pseudofrankia TaxID=2994372 RepID=UPI0008DAA20A|nr:MULTISPECIES: amidohydrolase family protein [unclassified Pseudofrankia]MDT3444057.1 amidohydrolase family protein [Pseudofrankia sp. BMG5.37]OHV65281.1 amidohydrolase [Pseudofrankia sp. BMG5.36]
MSKDFVVSADGHILEPIDLFKTRMPVHLRDRAVWEEDIELEEPLVEGGAKVFRKLHTPGFEGWTVSRYRQTTGRTPDGAPETIVEDLEADGVDACVMHPNLSIFGLYSDDHELSIEHARVYNGYLIERFLPYRDRIAPTCPIPLTDIDDAVAEIERVTGAGFKALLLPGIPPTTYWDPALDRVWDAARAAGAQIFFHTQTGGVKMKNPSSSTMRVVKENARQVNQPVTAKSAAERLYTQSVLSTLTPQKVICDLIGAGVAERYPELHFNLIEFNAHWLSSLVGAMDKAWTTGIGQDTDWWIGSWNDEAPPTLEGQDTMARIFLLNEKWPYPLMPSEYVQRQFHVSFSDDLAAVAARHITGVSSIIWGNDYPHAEGTFRGSKELLAQQFAGVPDAERKAIVGGTIAEVMGFKQPATV